MDYEYDVFFSYKRDRESDAWHAKVKTKLEFWLKQELQRSNVQIFMDAEDIRTGMRWRQKLADALKRSRCIACFWSPLYFQSKWCVSEWLTFAEREVLVNRDLVVPAAFFDGETYPVAAKAKQFVDLSEFTSTMPSYWNTESAVRFESLILRPLAKDLAISVRNAPPYDDGFPVVEAPDDQITPAGTIGRPANG